MYQAIQLNRLISAICILALLIFITILWCTKSNSAFQWIRQVTATATITGLVILVIGNKWVFCPLWQLKPLQSFLFPYIAGEWEGQISSNWQVVKAMSAAFIDGGEAHPVGDLDVTILGTEDKPITVRIEADLFRIRMRLETTDNYSTSQTIFVTPRRSLGVPELVYIYQNDTPLPEGTDALNHLGAGYLKIFARDSELVMEGTYWTARNWTKGLNTAGRIVLRRPSA